MKITPNKASYKVGEEIICSAEPNQGLAQPLILWYNSEREASAVGTLVPSENQVGSQKYSCVATIVMERTENATIPLWLPNRQNNTFSKSLSLSFEVTGRYISLQ